MRFLTPSIKEYTLQHLEKAYKKATSESDGSIDIEMIPYLKRLNKIRELVTSWSCSGHPSTKKQSKLNIGSCPGNLELWLSKRKMKLFDIHVLKLLTVLEAMPVRKAYMCSGANPGETLRVHEYASITFQGKEEGLDILDRSMTGIIKFFEELD